MYTLTKLEKNGEKYLNKRSIGYSAQCENWMILSTTVVIGQIDDVLETKQQNILLVY